MKPFVQAGSDHGSVGACGEEALIAAIRRWLGSVNPPAPAGIGDDCAVLPAGRKTQVRLITVDPLIFGRHFDAGLAAQWAGAKLLKRNLSDIAAMGGSPSFAVVSLVLSSDVSLRWLERFYRGLAAAARRYRVRVVGGDIAQAPGRKNASFLSAHLTLTGGLAAGRAVTRQGARLGDVIYVTGELGASLATGHHFRFEPRLREGRWLAARKEVRAMMDLSDGLGKDLRALTPRGGAPALLAEALPRRRGATVAQAVSDGEDYELLFAVARTADQAALQRDFRRAFPRTRLTAIGRFCPRERVPPGTLPLSRLHGYEHFR